MKFGIKCGVYTLHEITYNSNIIFILFLNP